MSEVLTASDKGVLVITINRPEAKNAVNGAVAAGVAAAMEELDSNPDLRVGIITGAGGTFCSGMDLKAFLKGETPTIKGKGFAGFIESPPKKPLIAAVDGYALAGGMEVAMTCDMIVANAKAQFGIPEAKRGLAAGAGGLIRLPRQIPYRVAMELALTGDFITAQRAYDIGFVNHVVDSPALEGAMALALKISANGPLAVQGSKQVIAESRFWSEEEMWKKQGALINRIFASADAREGAAAFAEKRAPNWTGR